MPHGVHHPSNDYTRREFLGMTLAASIVVGVQLPLAGESRAQNGWRERVC